MGLVEIVIGSAIIALTLIGVVAGIQRYISVGLQNAAKVKAAFYAEEGIEVARGLRDSSWTSFSALSSSTTYYLGFTGSAWVATSAPTTTLSGYVRTVSIGSVYRRASDHDIVPATSTESKYNDPGTRQVTVTVSYLQAGGTSTVQMATYLSDLF